MDPQERTTRHPVLEFLASKEPRGRSFILGLARNVVICGRVWRRKPFTNVLFYLGPWAEDSASKTDAIRGKTSQTLYFLRIVRHFLHSNVRFIDT